MPPSSTPNTTPNQPLVNPERPAQPGVEQAPAPTAPEVTPPAPAAAPSGPPVAPPRLPDPLKPPLVDPTAAAAPTAPPIGPTPSVAGDVDVIEKEWVDQADKIIDQTKGDPYVEEEAEESLQQDYLKKRYGHDVKKPDAS